jgi:hypothetical protein
MAYMFEVYYRRPPDPDKEARLTRWVSDRGGRLDFREEPDTDAAVTGFHSVCLTYEFDSLDQAALAAEGLRKQGEHVEGPSHYGPDAREAS